jgi:hypothetical protein
VVISDTTDGVDVGAVVGADVGVCGREDLEVPIWWLVVLFEATIGKEVQGRSLVTSSKNDNVSRDGFLAAWTTFRHAW